MSPAMAARLRDEATVVACTETSWHGPRDYLVDCARCGRPFWFHAVANGRGRRYCTDACRIRAVYDRRLARQRVA